MRIAYVCLWDLAAQDGVAGKILMQARLWRELGHDVVVFWMTPRPGDVEGVQPFVFGSVRQRLSASVGAARAARAFRPDVVYLRYDVHLPPIWALVRAEPTVVEVNSDTGDAMRNVWKNDVVRRYNRVNRALLVGAARGVVAVSRELAGSSGRPAVVVSNGIDLSAIEPLPAPSNERPRALFLGSPRQPWHGVDKLLRLAADMPEVDVDVVGYAHGDRALAGVVPPANVVLHGYLPHDRYLPIARRADFALGSLALHRAGLDEGAPLKVREYVALGLPVILAYADSDLAGVEAPWLLRLPNSEDNLAAGRDAVRAFAFAARGRRVPRSAVAPLVDAREKERRRLSFMDDVR
ncbi:MAG TPA: glycosyltransferase [Gaiellaceae bacterium]